MSVGKRLKEERNRIGLSQAALAALVGTTQKTQFEYEKDVMSPKATYLAAVAEHGVDALYVLMGTRNVTQLNADEQQLLSLFRGSTPSVKLAVMGALQAALHGHTE